MKTGKKAPNFTLKDQDGKVHKLSDYLGRKVIIYFYPKDMTSGCTLEANNFSDNVKKFEKLNVKILGISKDSADSHKKFCDKEGLKITLLSDEETLVCQKYGVWVEKSMYGKKYMGIQRDSFLIDENGKLIKHYEKVKPTTHHIEVLEDLNYLK